MDKNTIDISGKIYGRLTVVSYNKSDKIGHTFWNCTCACGKEKIIRQDLLNRNIVVSCGCYAKENSTTHGKIKTPEYRTWAHMKSRCTNPNVKEYKNYGGRGISMCERWLNSFENFLADMGERPSSKYSIDRFPNNDGNYEKSNCRWADKKQQADNRRSNVILEYSGIKMSQSEWAKSLGVNHTNIIAFLKRNKSFPEIAEHYINKMKNEITVNHTFGFIG